MFGVGRVAHAHNIAALRDRARRRLPRPIFDYIDGGADDELALRASQGAFDKYALVPNVLRDVSSLDTATTLFGQPMSWPLMLGPTGLTRLFHPQAERAVARAAAAAGLPYCLSTLGTTLIEDVAAASEARPLFQIYIFKDRGLTAEFVERARAARCAALVLTVDTVVSGNRERDIVNGLTLPPKLGLRTFLQFASRPGWSLPALFGEPFDFVNVSHRVGGFGAKGMALASYVGEQFDPSLTWKDVEWLAGLWDGPLVIKGVMSPADAWRAAESGASAVMISNHGGRQLDDAPAPIDQIAPVADAVGDRLEIICDGGIRRGSHVAKALALGATACSIGRPYLYGLAAGGEVGVARALAILRDEFQRTMILSGAACLDDLTPDMVVERRSLA